MDKQEVVKLFRFLGAIYPKAPEFRDKDAAMAWLVALEPYKYDDVRRQAVEWIRTNTYPPRVSELCSKIAPADGDCVSLKKDYNRWMDAMLDKQRKIPTCELLHRHPGIVGEIMRLHYPDAALCGEDHCPVWAIHGECPHQKTGGENEPKLECRGAGE